MKTTRTHYCLFLLLECCTPSGQAPSPVAPVGSNESARPPQGPLLSTVGSTTLDAAASDPSLSAPAPVTSTSEPSSPASNDPNAAAAAASIGTHTSPEAAPDAQALPADASGPAVGGPRTGRPCSFYESVDEYKRVCSARQNPDGSLRVEAKGTRLNPDNGFEFTMHGGPHNFFAHGTLNAFGICQGPFTAHVHTVIDKGVTTYELRFKDHCKIVIR